MTLEDIPCPHCGGAGCVKCRHRGEARLTQCPMKEIPAEVWTALRLATYAKHYHRWPNGGGTLDECRMTLNVFDLIWSEQHKAEKK